ncbi:MAG TPA: hypothetical protein DDY31_06055 [Lachnospiraceae bacterium]|nr:hypothetical protein [Lachnospiraceae bacterium]
MASGDLFRAFTVRFSFKKEQHVRMLQKFEDRKLNDGKSKNQVVMDALEMYYNSLENDSDTKEDKVITEQLLEQWLMKFRKEFREEMLRELLNIFVSGRMAGQPVMVSSSNGESHMEDVKEDGAADISGMPDVMDKIMSWSDS